MAKNKRKSGQISPILLAIQRY